MQESKTEFNLIQRLEGETNMKNLEIKFAEILPESFFYIVNRS